jgi:hypothetical protein
MIKKTMIILFMAVMVFSGCKNNAQHAGKKFMKVVKATSQKWSGGVARSGFGSQYFIQLQVLQGDIEIDTVWIDSRPFVPGKRYTKTDGQTIELNLKYTRRPVFDEVDLPVPGKWDDRPEQMEGPDFEGEGLIVFHVSGKRRLLVIEEFEVLEPIDYP